MDLLQFARLMPKVELHVHLEGSIRPETLLALAARNQVQLPAQDVQGLKDYYRFRDFGHFIEVYLLVSSCLRRLDDYELVAYEFGRHNAAQNIRYAEATFTIETNMRMTGLPWQEILLALNAGRARAQADFGVDWRWILDINRGRPETQDQVAEIALAARELGVVALGLGGDEANYPPELFQRAFDRAHSAGLACIPHAGENAGPGSVWTAIETLHALRVGHGVRAIEDERLVETLARRQITLEVCPTSNLRLGIYPDYAAHPLRRLWQAGVQVTVNSDDPPMFNCDLAHEHAVLVEEFGFSAEELVQINLNALHACLLPVHEKRRLEEVLRAEYAQLLG